MNNLDNRMVPFDPDAICDLCGAVGAFDFMGDFYCEECVDDMKDEWEDDEYDS